MTTETQTILSNLSNSVTSTKLAWDKAEKDLADAVSIAKDYERQINVHTSNNDMVNAGIVAQRLNQQYQTITQLSNNRDAAKAAYDKAVLDYNNAKNTLLSPEEKQAEILKAQAELNATNAKIASDAEAEKTKKMIKNSIIAGVIIVVIIIGIVIYKKYKK